MIENKISQRKVIFKKYLKTWKKKVENIVSLQTNFCFEKYRRIIFRTIVKKMFLENVQNKKKRRRRKIGHFRQPIQTINILKKF